MKIKRLIFGIIVIVSLIVIIINKNSFLKSENKTDVLIGNSNLNKEEIVEENINSENIIKENEKIDFLQNLSKPVYKKDEKDIKIPIIIYHAFSTPELEGDIYKLFSTQERFEENIITLLNDGYTFITLEDLYKYNNNEIGLPEKVCIITMDDGWLGCYTEAFPVLEKYNVPATIFIVSNLVGTDGYFSWDQAKQMYDSGFVKLHIHGKSHIEYSSVSKEKLISDYTSAHKELEEKMGESIQKIMAYPSGKYTENSKQWLKEAGFEIQVLTKYGTVNKSRTLDLTELGRIRGEQASRKSIMQEFKS